MTPAEVAQVRAGLRAVERTLDRYNHGPVPFVLADGVCPVCFSKGEHVGGCPRAQLEKEEGEP